MARRVCEQEYLTQNGTPLQSMGAAKDLKLTKEIKFHKTFNGVYSLQFNPTGDVLAVGYGAGGIQLYDPDTCQMTKELRPCRQGGYPVMALRYHPKDPDLLYAATAEGHIYIYNIHTGELVLKIEEPGNEINSFDFCVDGFNFVTGGKDLSVRVYEKNKLLKTYGGLTEESLVTDQNKPANTMRVFSIKFHPDNEYIFVTGGWDNQLKIWDIRDNDGIKRSIRGPHICGDSVDWKGNTLLTGQWSALHALQMFDYTSGKVVKEVKYPHKDGAFLYVAAYLNDTTVMAGGSGTNALDVVELDTNRHIGQHKLNGPVHAADSAKDGRVIAVGGSPSSFAILKMND